MKIGCDRNTVEPETEPSDTEARFAAKGGIVVALKEEFDLPVKFIGVGEKMDDLLPFEIEAFAEEVLEA